MKSYLIICDYDSVSESKDYDEVLNISCREPHKNLNLEINNLTNRILDDLDPLEEDFLFIAAYVYYADSSFSRWSEKDVYASKWIRKFDFVIPVNNPDIWNSTYINDLLCNSINIISGDNFSFKFIKTKRELYRQMVIKSFADLPPVNDAKSVCLFSGGLDSFAGAIDLYRNGKNPILVSHRSSPKIDSRQKRVVELIRSEKVNWSFPHLNVWINRKGKPASEQSQRTRSFLFLAIASCVANHLRINDLYLFENGIVTFNIPKSGQNIGTFLSRSTHPKFVHLFQEIVREVFNPKLQIYNPYIFKSKSEVIRTLIGSGFEKYISATVSCAHTQLATSMNPHCGTCSQCVDRRFALSNPDLRDYEELSSYGKDIFIDDLSEGEERTHCENYFRSALQIDKMLEDNFFMEYTELLDSVNYLDISAADAAEKIYSIYKRHSLEVLEIVKQKISEHRDHIMRGELSESCLLSMIYRGVEKQEPLQLYSNKISAILHKGLRKSFQDRSPTNERDVQNQIEALLSAAGERLKREAPYLYFSIVQTKPDFSSEKNTLFIEAKFIKSKERLNRIITEITSRIVIYRDQGAHVLFLVYDNDNSIIDEEEFIQDFVKYHGIYIKVVR